MKQTLPRNLGDTSHPDSVFVVLDYDSQDDLIPYLQANHAADIKSGRLVVYSYRNGGGPFRLAHSKNMAMRCGILEGADVLVMMDADNSGGVGFGQFISSSFAEPGIRPGIFLCPNYQLIKSLPHGALRPARGYAGRLAVWAQTFIKLGGYSELFDTWRGEDIDMNFRLLRMGYQMRHIPNAYLNAINHNAEVRFREYPHAQKYESADELEVIRARTDTIVNYGQFGMGEVRRNFSDEPIELAAVPTRIFGIGMHKTATTSLHKALQLLKLDSFHWGAGEAPLIWHEMQALGRSSTLEQYYALSDLPIPLLYRELDRAYPGSKFILTIRNETDWIKSVEKLWSYEHNPTRYLWDIYPFSNHIHTMMYGQKEFNREVMLSRYRQHNAEVREYFWGREDLLILDMELCGKLILQPWKFLCELLRSPVPAAPYPRANRSGERDKATFITT